MRIAAAAMATRPARRLPRTRRRQLFDVPQRADDTLVWYTILTGCLGLTSLPEGLSLIIMSAMMAQVFVALVPLGKTDAPSVRGQEE